MLGEFQVYKQTGQMCSKSNAVGLHETELLNIQMPIRIIKYFEHHSRFRKRFSARRARGKYTNALQNSAARFEREC